MAELSFDDLIPRGGKGKALSFDDLIPKRSAGYQEARKKVEARQELRRTNNLKYGGEFLGGIQNAMDDWTGQVARNTGAFDEVAYGVDYGLQGLENFVRRAQGKPVRISAADAGKAAMDYEREVAERYKKDHPTGNALAMGASIATAARPTGNALKLKPIDAGLAAAILNTPFAFARQEGNLKERLPGAAVETAITFGTGATLQGVGNAVAAKVARAKAKPPTPQRELSRQGVELTPGQMVGGAVQRFEDAMTSVPILGDAIRDARIRGIESFNKVALDKTLEPIAEALPEGTKVGRDGVKVAGKAISDAYKKALAGVNLAPDAQLSQEFNSIANTPNLTAAQRETLDTVMSDMASRLSGPVDGQTWKLIDSDLGKAVRAADNASASQPGGTLLRDALERLRTAHQGLLQRVDQVAAEGVKAADTATANLARVRHAGQYPGTSARGGVFTPADLNRAVQQMDTSAGNRAFAEGDALMQDLTDPAMEVLPQVVPDSGTPIRSMAAMMGLGGLGAQTGAVPAETVIGAGVAAAGGAAVYSRPVQSLLNTIYRATEPAQVQQALATLSALASRDPQLQVVYRQALEHLDLPLEGPSAVGVQAP